MEEEWCDCVVALLIVLLTMLILNVVQIKAETGSVWRAIQFAILFPAIMVIVTTMLLMYPFLIIYRAFLSIKLRVMFGKKFYGLLHGLDAPLSHPIKKYGMIGGLIIVEIDTSVTQKSAWDCVREFVDEKVLTNEHLAKLRTSVSWYGGYPFLENIDVKSNAFVRKLPTVEGILDDATLMKLLGQCHYMPFSGPLMWDVMVGTQPLLRKQSSNPYLKQYPIMIRVHHGLADAVTIMQLVAGVFGDKFRASPVKRVGKLPEAEDYIIARLFQLLGQIACVMVYFPSVLYLCTLVKTDFNELHLRGMGDDENIAVEFDDNGTYLQKVKKIRNYTGATVPEIISTAYNESLKEHFLKYKKRREDHFTFLFPVGHNYEEMENVQSIDAKDLKLSNRFAILTLAMPFSIESDTDFDPRTPLYSRLSIMRRKTNALKKSVEFHVSMIIYHLIAPVFPSVCLYFFSYLTNITSIISLIPGLPRGSYCNGALLVTDSAFWIPHLLSIGSFVYDDRLIVSLNCDGSCMSREMAQEIVQNVYKNIDLLEEELGSITP
ncbi:uncharacterized protein LOC116172959 isoform X2 [Photinus pyralis]|uniref:uncharacterized protein LOC116172959 isoform X2 n=1 Tax=Photinus pyralis TaxID=7054 RepID=UPI00126778D9|nr:uncharacterized protein LOC116172959 isoform X2 [Photinus pyralis]